MSTIQELFQQAELAEAAYADFAAFPNSVTDALKFEGFSDAQATAFVSQWRVVNQSPLDGFSGSGFSATLFERLDADQQPTGQYTLGIAGSTSFIDAGADFSLTTGGVAFDQLVSMVNYVLRLQAGSAGTTRQVELLTGVTSPTLTSSYVNGVGPSISPAELTTSGHSLGGFLGQVYQRIFGSAGVYTYNALGVVRPDASIFDQLAILLGFPPSSFSSGVGENLLVPGEPAQLIGTVQGKPQIQVFSETQSTTIASVNTIPAHKIGNLTDALAVYNLFATLDPSLNTANPADGMATITRILDATSNIGVKTLESVVSGLGKLFSVPGLTFTGNEFDIDRDKLYASISSINQVLQGGGQIVALVDLSAAQIASIASAPSEDSAVQAFRYALKVLNPYAVVGSSTLYAAHNANGEITLYDPATESGRLTTRYLTDRSQMLFWQMTRNTNDIANLVRRTDGGSSIDFVNYRDVVVDGKEVTVKDTVLVRGGTGVGKLGLQAQMAFGSDKANTLYGSGYADELFGGGGKDTLDGQGGDDYLEGGQGDDDLIGGEGNDTYVYLGKEGEDTIVDTGGLGKIVFAGQDLSGTYVQKGADPRTFGNAQFTLTWKGDLNDAGRPNGIGALTITKDGDASGTLTIQGFDNATAFLGINLNGVPSTQVFTDLYGTNDNDTLDADAPFQKVYGLQGNDRITVATTGAEAYGGTGNDYISNGTGDQKLYGDEGNDILVASGGNDELYGGFDNDALQGGADDDYLEGGDGNDVLDGGAGSDVLIGGEGSDFILGGGSAIPNIPVWDPANIPDYGVLVVNGVAGVTNMVGYLNIEGDAADVLDGGAGNDTLLAGDGDDLLIGGVGDDLMDGQSDNDTLFGGDGADILYGDGTQGSITVSGQDPYTLPQFHGDDYLDGGAGDDFLIGDGGSDDLYGGDGNDTLVGDASNLDEQYHGADYLDGGAGDDHLFGYGKDDMLVGGTGNDVLEGDSSAVPYAKHGNDYLDGGDGNDILQGDGGSDTLYGGADNDQLFGDSDDTPAQYQGDDYLDGEAGDDYLRGYGGNDTLFGGDGVDQLLGEAGDDYLDGEAGDDLMSGGDGSDQLFGGEGADDLQGDAGDDYLEGEDGNDLLSGGSGNDQLFGGAGDDQLAGDDGDDVLGGGEGNDTLFGGDGNDTLIGGAGVDALIGGAGNDIIVVNLADGDIVIDNQGTNTLQTAYDGDVSALSISQVFDADGKSYLALVDFEGSQVSIQDGFVGAVSQFDFGGPSTIARRELMGQAQVAALTLNGDVVSEHFISGNNADQINSDGGDDVIEALAGNDLIDGGTGADTMLGGAGDDTYFVDNAGDVVAELAGEGVDTVKSSVTYTLAAEVENLTLTGTASIDATGNALDNVLTGNAAANTLGGGVGNDTIIGGFGADTYLFGRGAGQDVIQETDDGSNAPDKVQFAADVAPTDVAVSRTTNDLVLTITATGDKLTVANYFTTSAAVVEQFRFNDGTVWNDATIAQKLSSGTPGSDIIDGTAGNDVLNGLAGNDYISGLNGNDRLFGEQGADTLNGGNGADILDGGVDPDDLYGGNGGDTYIFARGYGQDFITETDDGTNPVDQIQFAADILPADVTARRNGNSLEVSINGTTDEVFVNYYFNYDAVSQWVVEQLRFGDGTIWDVATVKAKVLLPTQGADTLTGYASDDVINGAGGNDTIDGGAGNDTLRGGTGFDSLNGGAGSDTYFYDLGDGRDTILNNDSSAATDTLVFGAGILPSSIPLTRGGTVSDLFIMDSPMQSNVLVTIPGYFNSLGGPGEVDEIRFTDDPATVWTVAGVRAMLLAANDNANTLVGFSTNDTIDGLGGNDWISGAAGNDTLFGGAGNDTVRGDTGDDQIDGGAGDDFLYGNAGSDVMLGGAGNDTLFGEELDTQFETPGVDTLDGGAGKDFLTGRYGNDIYVFGRGYGYDTIDESTYVSDGFDTLRLNAGVLPADVSLFRHADDLVVTFAGDQAQAWISKYFTLANKPIEQIVFNDGTIWDATAIASRIIIGTQNAMTGTAGDDTFIVDHVLDTITEGFNQGTDTVQSSVTYSLPADVENITLTGILDITATGNTLDNIIIGNAGDNILFGDYGNDMLYGGQGDDWLDGGIFYSDTLVGGQGNDTYIDSGGKTIIEAAGEGIDTVISNSGVTTYTLGSNLENLTVQSGYIYALIVNGNELDNVITGRTDLIGDTIDGGAGADIMTSAGGFFIVDNAGDQVIASYGDQTTIKSKIDWTLTANHASLQLLTGTAALNGTGNAVNNVLKGNENANVLNGVDGNDTIFGGLDGNAVMLHETGPDTLIGGRGDDIYNLGDFWFLNGSSISYNNWSGSVNQDVIIENAGEGVDTVQSLFDYTLTDNVENLTLLMYTGGYSVIPLQATGNALANQITGNSGANIIDGRGGADTMIGGLGNDTYYVDDAGDVVTENAGGGTGDTVIAEASYILRANVENLTLAGTNGISGTGNALDNRLDGSQNGAGNVLSGGLGNDTYIVGAGDTIVENAGEGFDTIQSDISYALGANIENLVLTGLATTTGTGDANDNTLNGSQNGAVNTLIGGLGNDTYVVDGSDVIVENPGEGIDTVTAAFDYTLSASLENLTLKGSAVFGTGNADSNVITGNASDNVLDGAGGADVLRGLGGSDTYVIDDAGDVTDETDPIFGGDAGGNDMVQASVTYTLGANLENLTLTGAAAIDGTGNALGNILTGNSAANVLAGGAGSDTYVVDTGDNIVENADEGTDTVQSSTTYTLGANLENLLLSGIEAINGTGNALDNWLTGNSAANVLDGGTGTDILVGELGNDTYRFARGAGSDAVYEYDATAGNIDTIEMATGILPGDIIGTASYSDLVLSISGTSDTLTVWSFFWGPECEVERVVFADGTVWDVATLKQLVEISGTSGADTLNGTAGDNRIFGLAGNDTLNGLDGNDYLDGGAGADTMVGGAGDDTYLVDNTGDIVTESSSTGGYDTVLSSVTRTLGSRQESLILTGTSAISGTGNTLDNQLYGNSANNTLDGGTGADWLYGGLGNDIYVVDNVGDGVEEYADEGADTVNSSLTYTLTTNVENLTLTGSSAIDATGNALDNVLTGNSAANVLTGGMGNDTYVFGTGDSIVEYVDEGTDTVQSSVTFTLGADFENLTLTGTTAINGTGNELDNVLTGNSAANVLTGGEGNDTYVVGTGDTVTEAASAGTDTVMSDVAWTLGSNLENLFLTGSTAINGTGNTLDNVLTGNIANNTLDGGTGADTLSGGLGNDAYVVDNVGDVVTENAGEGTDTVNTSVAYTLSANVENLTLTSTTAINGTGNALNNVLTGNSAANVLTGAAGDDTYVVGTGDSVVENANEGTDTVQSSIAFTLGANVENLTLTGSTAINGTGNALDNVFTGNSVANALTGGAGNDTYVVGTGDSVIENASEGTDTVQSSVTFTLGANVENLTLTGTTVISGTGNALDNVLTGNSVANTLTGAAGNDTYFVGTGDTVTEAASAGTDTVMSDVAWTLGSNLENLFLIGITAINGTGNTLNNVLTGNSANNTLDGGTGADTLSGGLGNDTYVVDNAGDVVTENAGEGTDTVNSLVTYALSANVENLTLTSTTAINGTGNALNNVLTGNSAANVLTGAAGDDTYVVGTGDSVVENANEGTDTVQSSIAFTLGANVENLTLTGATAINGTGNALDNVLTGNSATNVLTGGAGNDTYFVGTGDTVTEAASAGTDIVQSSVTFTLGANVENLTLTGSTAINGTGNVLDNVLTGNSVANTLTGAAGNDTYFVSTGDTVTEAASAGTDTVMSDITWTLGSNLENLFLTGATAINGTGNTIANLLRGNSGNNALTGAAGVDVLEGGAGNDALSDSAGTDNGYLNGGAGTDTLTGGSGREFFMGGTGNDTLTTGTGADIIAFNKGDGQDTVNASTGQDNVLALGGNLNYSDFAFRVVGSDLVLDTGASENLTFKSWYTGSTNKSVLTLQVVAEAMVGFDAGSSDPLLNKKVQTFDFAQLVNAFDSALVANPGLTSWALTNGLAQYHLSGSDTDALGGDLSYQYGENGTVAGIGFDKAQDVLTSAQFGTQAQTLRPLAGLQNGMVPLG